MLVKFDLQEKASVAVLFKSFLFSYGCIFSLHPIHLHCCLLKLYSISNLHARCSLTGSKEIGWRCISALKSTSLCSLWCVSLKASCKVYSMHSFQSPTRMHMTIYFWWICTELNKRHSHILSLAPLFLKTRHKHVTRNEQVG